MFHRYGLSGYENTHNEYSKFQSTNEYIDVETGIYVFKVADAEGDGWGNAQFSLCYANMDECLGSFDPQYAKVVEDPDGKKGIGKISLQGKDYVYTDTGSSTIEKTVSTKITCPNGYYCPKVGATFQAPIRCGCTKETEEVCDWNTASNYYCPAGTSTRLNVDRANGYCGAKPINWDAFRYTAQLLCPRLAISFDNTAVSVSTITNVTSNRDTYNVDIEIMQPGVGIVEMSFKNVGGSSGHYGKEYDYSSTATRTNSGQDDTSYIDRTGDEWGSLAADSDQKPVWENGVETLVPATMSFAIDSGALEANANKTFTYQMYFNGNGNWDNRQIVTININIMVTAPGDMLVFPFDINANLRVGESAKVSVFIFNIGNSPIPYYNLTVPSSTNDFLSLQRECGNGDCGISGGTDFQRVTATLTADMPSRTSPYQSVFKLSSPNSNKPVSVQVKLQVAVGPTNTSTTTVDYVNLPKQGVDKSVYDKCYPVCESLNSTFANEYRNCYTNKVLQFDGADGDHKCGFCSSSKADSCKDVPIRTFLTEVLAPIEIEIRAHDKFLANSVDNDNFVIAWTKQPDAYTTNEQIASFSKQTNAIRMDGNIYSGYVTPDWRGAYLVEVVRKLNTPGTTTTCATAHLNNTICYEKLTFDKILTVINVDCPLSSTNNERGDGCLCNPGFQPAAKKGDTKGCEKCIAGKYKDTIGEEACAQCETGKYSELDGSANCTESPAGYSTNVPIEATGIVNCNSNGVANKYAAIGSPECEVCPVPLQILQGSDAASIDDCVCAAGYYKQNREDGTFKDCLVCPTGGICLQGTENVESIKGKPGFWRPSAGTPQFWPCNVPTVKDSNAEWNLWLNCLGGSVSTCAPVFNWANAIVEDEEGDEISVSNALTKFNLAHSVDDFETYANKSSTKIWFSAIYVAYIGSLSNHAGNNETHLNFDEWIDKARTVPGYAWVGGEPAMNFDNKLKAAKSAILGYHDGPICSICPAGTGRDGDFSSSNVCTPCPEEGNNGLRLVGMFAAAIIVIALMVMSQISKGSHERELQLAHAQEHHKDMDKAHAEAEKEKELQKQLSKAKSDGSEIDDDGDDTTGEEDDSNGEKPISLVDIDFQGKSSSKLLTAKSSYFSVEQGKNDIYQSVLRLAELQKENGTRSGKLISHKQILTGMVRIFFSYMQVLALARSLPIAWPTAVEDILDTMATFSSPSLSLTSVDCAISGKKPDELQNVGAIYVKFWMTMLIPVLAVLGPLFIWGAYYSFGNMIYQTDRGEGCCFKSMVKSKGLTKKQASKINIQKLREKTIRRLQVSCIVTLFLFYPTTCKGVVKMWACKTYGTFTYLVADLSVECYKGEHNLYVIIATFFFFAYCIGIPFLAYKVLSPYIPGIHFNPRQPISEINPPSKKKYTEKDRKELLKMKLTAASVYGFMWQGFQEKGLAPYWEAVIINSRKLVLIMLIELFQDLPSNYQMVFALIVMFFYNLLHVNYHPYDSFYHDRLEFLSLAVSELTLFFGLLLNFMEFDKNCVSGCLLQVDLVAQARVTMSGFIIFCNVVFLLYFLIGFIYHVNFLMPKQLRCIGNSTTKKLHKQMVAMPVVKNVYKNVMPNVHHKALIHDQEEQDDDTKETRNLQNELELVAIMQKAGMEEEALRKDLEIRKKHADDKLKMRLRNKIHGVTEVDDDDDDDIVENASSSMALEDSLISNDDQLSFISNTDMSSGSIMTDDD